MRELSDEIRRLRGVLKHGEGHELDGYDWRSLLGRVEWWFDALSCLRSPERVTVERRDVDGYEQRYATIGVVLHYDEEADALLRLVHGIDDD